MSPISQADVRALHQALECEYRSCATYTGMISAIGNVPLLVRIRDVHAVHLGIIETLHGRYGVPLPHRYPRLRVARCTDAASACSTAIAAELERVDFYKKLIGTAHDGAVVGELQNLERAS